MIAGDLVWPEGRRDGSQAPRSVHGLADDGTGHMAIDRVLSEFPGNIARRAAAALRAALGDRVAADGEGAWSSSRLTGDGYPVEFTFSTADNRLRYTAEPGSRCATPRQRLEMAVDLVRTLGSVAVPQDVMAALRALMYKPDLRYGAWLGGRHGPAGDEYKVYVELPDGAIPGNGRAAPLPEYPLPRLPDRTVTPRMLAYSPGSRRWEVYLRIKSLAPHHIPRVLAPAGLDASAGDLLGYIASAYGHSLGDRLPGPSVGVSYSMPPPKEIQSVTLHFYARSFWGADARIRKQFGHLSRGLGWDDRRYQRVTDNLAENQSWATNHGLLSITLTRDGLAASIGVRPPEAGQ